jgi:hypothetical protein
MLSELFGFGGREFAALTEHRELFEPFVLR